MVVTQRCGRHIERASCNASSLGRQRRCAAHGHFLRGDVIAFAAAHKVQGRANSMPEAWATRAIEHARSELPAQAGSHWMQTLDTPTRERHRAIGRKLMALTLQYVSSEDDANSDHLLNEARAVGREYGEANIQ